MKLHELKPAAGSRKDSKRVGRGIGSGKGKTSTRGHKGQWSRAGGGVRPGFEGGQMPLTRRLPKYGFNNPFKKQYNLVNVKFLNRFAAGTLVTPQLLYTEGLINDPGKPIKVLGHGELEIPLTIQAHKFSESAATKIASAGGKAEVI
ncbi:MAG: 50S ribosomal protein L15 [Symbiobacteriaceae bacterium]|nr:50S ribosomal protein L15 [Symbiobacteriaceae bacterium]